MITRDLDDAWGNTSKHNFGIWLDFQRIFPFNAKLRQLSTLSTKPLLEHAQQTEKCNPWAEQGQIMAASWTNISNHGRLETLRPNGPCPNTRTLTASLTALAIPFRVTGIRYQIIQNIQAWIAWSRLKHGRSHEQNMSKLDIHLEQPMGGSKTRSCKGTCCLAPAQSPCRWT